MPWTGAVIAYGAAMEEKSFNESLESLPENEAKALREERNEHRKALEVARASRPVIDIQTNNYTYC